MMEYPCPLYMQRLFLLTEALSAALFFGFSYPRKNTRT
jgi:hypothetical protein